MARWATVALGALLLCGCGGVDDRSRHFQAGLQGGRDYASLDDPRDECEQFAQLYARALSGWGPGDPDAVREEVEAGCLAAAEAG